VELFNWRRLICSNNIIVSNVWSVVLTVSVYIYVLVTTYNCEDIKIALQAYTGPSLSAPYDAAVDDVAKCFGHGAWLDHFILRLLLTVRYSEIFKIDQCFKKI